MKKRTTSCSGGESDLPFAFERGPASKDERELRETRNVQKNAERAAMRAQFRNKYQLSENSKDNDQLSPFGGKVSLPPELANMLHPEIKTKDDGFNLLNAFQSLSFNKGMLTGRKHSNISTPTPPNGDPKSCNQGKSCNVKC